MQHYKTRQNIVNSKTKQKSKTILGVIRNLVLDFILYFVTAYIIYMRKYTCNMNMSFSSKCGSLFSVMRDNFSVLFHLKLYMLSTKGTHQVQIFRLSTARIKINQIPFHFLSLESVFP